MSESNHSDSNTESSFDLIDDYENDQKKDKVLISPSISSTSTEHIEDLNEEYRKEFRMESEFKEKVNIADENRSSADARPSQPVTSISERVPNVGDSIDEFDNQKLQEQLNMQIQANQEHLQFSQQVQLSPQRLNQQSLSQSGLGQPNLIPQNLIQPNFVQQNLSQQGSNQPLNQSPNQPPIQPQILQQQLNPQMYNQISQKFVQLQQSSNGAQSSPQSSPQTSPQTSPQSNQPSNPSMQPPIQSMPDKPEAKPIHNVPLVDNQVARIASPIANFDPSAYLPSWCKKDLFNRVAENAVNSFNTVLITLDPQMKELLKEGGPSVLVTSTHPFDVDSIRDGFLDVFKRATVKSIDHFSSVETAAQLVGFQTAHKISLERVKGLRENISIVPCNQIIVSIENFLYNFNERWFDSDYFLLDDPLNGVQLSVHTQGTPIDEKYIEQLRLKAGNNKHREDGFSMRIDSLIASDLQCNIGDWHREYVGFDKCKLHYQAALLLSNLYKNKLKSIGRPIE